MDIEKTNGSSTEALVENPAIANENTKAHEGEGSAQDVANAVGFEKCPRGILEVNLLVTNALRRIENLEAKFAKLDAIKASISEFQLRIFDKVVNQVEASWKLCTLCEGRGKLEVAGSDSKCCPSCKGNGLVPNFAQPNSPHARVTTVSIWQDWTREFLAHKELLRLAPVRNLFVSVLHRKYNKNNKIAY